jgi:hypothetical protein
MLNLAPIFVNGFSRGGTTILTNLLASHPDVCLLGELHHVFNGSCITDSSWEVVRKCLCYDAPLIMAQCQDFFSPRLIRPRKTLSRWARTRIDLILHREKLRSAHPLLNRFKQAETEYTSDEIAAARLLGKNIDGMIYATDAWAEMYPDAVFFGLVRNGLAICEGHLRRGRSASEIGQRYAELVDKMLDDAARLPRYRMVRFEDLLAAPWETLQSACVYAGLDAGKVRQIRMQTRRVMDAQGNHRLCGTNEWDVVWLPPEQLTQYFQRDVDNNQIRRLSAEQREEFLNQAGAAMERLGYLASEQTRDDDSQHERHVLPFVRPVTSPPSRIARAA